MKPLIVTGLILVLSLGCETTPEIQISKDVNPEIGGAVRSPFAAMAGNAVQSNLVLGNIYFQYDRAQLTESAKRTLDQMVPIISQREGQVIVEGHADHCNTDKYNQRLGYQRALAAADYLKSAGVWEERLTIQSFGESRPQNSNWSKEGRMENRRVTVKLFPQGEGLSRAESDRVLSKMRNLSSGAAATGKGSVNLLSNSESKKEPAK